MRDSTLAVLDVQGVVKSFGGMKAVDEVSLVVHPGRILGLVGPNGAGKSTLINMVSGLIRTDAGRILYLGTPIHHLSPDAIARLGIARTFQVVRPLRDLSVVENVMVGALFGRRNCKSTRDARRLAHEALERVHLEHRAEAECRDISTGETKRLDLARAIAMDPQLLLLDEPLAGVGVRESPGLVDLIVEMANDGKGILLVEHVMRVVWTISHRVVVLHHGERIADGPPDQVAQDSQVIAAYLGDRYIREVLNQNGDSSEEGLVAAEDKGLAE